MHESLSPQNQQISPWAPEYKQAQLQQSAETIGDGMQIANMYEFDIMEDAVLTGRVYDGEPGWTRGAVGVSTVDGAEMWRLDKSERQDDGSYVTHSKWASAEDVQAQTKEYQEGLARKAVVAKEAGGTAVSAAVTREQVIPAREAERQQQARPEFEIGGVNFALNGFMRRGSMLFTTRDAQGAERDVIVYESRSGGGYRVSQGREYYGDEDENGNRKIRLMKGAESSYDAQYTQDTQLHPEFEKKIYQIEDKMTQLRAVLPELTIIPKDNKQDSERLAREFEGNMHVFSLGSEYLNSVLHEIPAGALSTENVFRYLNLPSDTRQNGIEHALGSYVTRINEALRASGAVPDFAQQPVAVAIDEHPQLGQIRIETFHHHANNTTYEWQMASDSEGRTWIQRIRFANASPSAYGTDKEMVYSGILTSKPLEYKEQLSAIPSGLRREVSDRYEDITPFLAQFSPIAQYKAQIEQRSQAVR